jgi:transcription factor SPN1
MSDNGSDDGRLVATEPVDAPSDAVNDGQEQEFEQELEAADSDRDSDVLSEIDENQFEDYDPETANIEDRPVDIDEDNARTLKVSKRKRVEGQPKRPREGRREKKRRDRDEDVAMDEADAGEGGSKPRRRRAAEGERAPRTKEPTAEPKNEENLTPEERRKRAIDRALDAAIKKGGPTTKRRRKDEIVRELTVRFIRVIIC